MLVSRDDRTQAALRIRRSGNDRFSQGGSACFDETLVLALRFHARPSLPRHPPGAGCRGCFVARAARCQTSVHAVGSSAKSTGAEPRYYSVRKSNLRRRSDFIWMVLEIERFLKRDKSRRPVSLYTVSLCRAAAVSSPASYVAPLFPRSRCTRRVAGNGNPGVHPTRTRGQLVAM